MTGPIDWNDKEHGTAESEPTGGRLRYAVARLLDRLPGQCSTSVWQWANRDTPRTSPWAANQRGCRLDAARNGSCVCGKVTGDQVGREARD